MGKNRERVRSCFSPRLKPPRQTRGRPQFIAAERITPRGVMREGRACRGRTRAASRSEAKSRGIMREGRACRGRIHAGPVLK